MVNIGSTSVGGRVLSVKTDTARLSLTMPVCTLEKEKVALSRRIEGHWRCVWGCVCVCAAPASCSLPRCQGLYTTSYPCPRGNPMQTKLSYVWTYEARDGSSGARDTVVCATRTPARFRGNSHSPPPLFAPCSFPLQADWVGGDQQGHHSAAAGGQRGGLCGASSSSSRRQLREGCPRAETPSSLLPFNLARGARKRQCCLQDRGLSRCICHLFKLVFNYICRSGAPPPPVWHRRQQGSCTSVLPHNT